METGHEFWASDASCCVATAFLDDLNVLTDRGL
jgi:hypothetical protein